MSKTTILSYHTSIVNTIKSGWPAFWIASGIIFLLVSYLLLLFFEQEAARLMMYWFPPSERQGDIFFVDFVMLARAELLWFALLLLLAWGFYAYLSADEMGRSRFVVQGGRSVYCMMLICTSFFLMAVWFADVILEAFPNSSDEYAYLFQAEMFSRGKLWERAHDLPGFFFINNIPQHDGILVSRFPPGWPLVLSSAFEIGMSPTLVNPLLGLLSLVVLYFFAVRYYDRNVAVWTLVIVGLCGFFLFNSASFFSHVSCFLVTLSFVYCVYLYRDKQRLVYAVLAGFFLSFVVLIRYYTALLIFLPFLVYLLVEHRWGVVPLFVGMALGSIPCMAYLLWYNYSITGNALLPVTVWAYPHESVGFVRGHTFLKGVEHLVRWMLMFIYWVSPGLLLLYGVFLVKKLGNSAERLAHPEDYAFLMLTIGYFFYYQIGGNQYGPRFLFEGFPFLALFVVHRVFQSGARWAIALLVACAIYPLLKLPFISYREGEIIDQRQDLYRLVKEQKITNAVVFILSPTSPLRPMPADDLTRNDPMFMNDVIYALALPGINDQIMEYYDGRAFYQYIRDVESERGQLVRIR